MVGVFGVMWFDFWFEVDVCDVCYGIYDLFYVEFIVGVEVVGCFDGLVGCEVLGCGDVGGCDVVDMYVVVYVCFVFCVVVVVVDVWGFFCE